MRSRRGWNNTAVSALDPSVDPVGLLGGREREQGTLEPILITPIRRGEFLVGKALAVADPTLTIAYVIFGIFLAATAGRSGSGSRSPLARPTFASSSSSAWSRVWPRAGLYHGQRGSTFS